MMPIKRARQKAGKLGNRPAGRNFFAGRTPATRGFTLAETLITVALVAILLVVYTTLLFGTIFLRRAQYYTQAANYIQEELDTLHTLPYAELLTRTDGHWLGVTVARGDWPVTEDTGDSQGQRLRLSEPPTAVVEETGLVVLPGNYRDNFTFSAKVRVSDASPSGWGAGLAFRYRDAENHYRFRFAAGGIALDRVQYGVRNTLWSQSATYDTNTWYTLEVVAADENLTLKRNGVTLTTVVENALVMGDLAVISLNSAQMDADDVSVTVDAVTDDWDFETEDLGSLPVEWQRLSYIDLPNGTGTLSIEDYLSEANMKKATVTVGWQGSDSTRSVTGVTVISK